MSEPHDEFSIFTTDPAPPQSGGEIQLRTDRPSEFLGRLHRESQRRPDGVAARENERGLITKARRATDEEAVRLASPPPPIAEPVPKRPPPSAKPIDAKPASEDSAAHLGAPHVEKDIDCVRRPSGNTVSSVTPSDAHFDRAAPMSPDRVAGLVTAPTSDSSAVANRVSKNQPEPKQSDPSHADPVPRATVRTGDPIDLCAGAFVDTVVDIVVPTAVMAIRMARSYRSGRPYFGAFGFGWDHNYNAYLRPLADGSIAMWTGELRERTFRWDGSGWEPEPGLIGRLAALTGAMGAFEVVYPRELRWRFERPPGWSDAERIPLVAMTDRHGNSLRLAYDPVGRVASVRDDAGRGLLFHYGNCGLLELVTDHDGLRGVRYEHDGEAEHLVRVVHSPTRGFPAGMSTTYEYDVFATHPAMRHNITSVIDSHGGTYLQNEYAPPDAGWAFNAVTRQLAGDFESRLEYEQVQYVPADEQYLDIPSTRTSVRPPDGSLHVYTFNYRGELLDHRFRLSADRTYRVVASQWRYDRHGNTIESVAPDGARRLYTYDSGNANPCARGNLLRVELAAPVPSIVPSRTVLRLAHDPQYQLPIRVTDEGGHVTRVLYDFDAGDPAATGRPRRIELPKVTQADGSVDHCTVVLEHNARGQLTALVSPEGCRTEREYVAGGRQDGLLAAVVADPAASRLTTRYEYDSRGFLSRVVAPSGRATHFAHNDLGQLEEIVPPPGAGAVADPIRRWFGDHGQVVRIERPRGSYDGLISEQYFVDHFRYDVLGRLSEMHLAANTTSPRHVRVRLDHEGRPLSSLDGSAVQTTRKYDERGAKLRETVGAGTPNAETTRYSYDRAGRLRRVIDSLGRISEIVRDEWGREIELRARTGSMTRDALGRETTLPAPTYAVTRSRWSDDDRLVERWIEVAETPPRLLQRETYDYDERGRLRARTVWSFNNSAAAVPLTTRYLYNRDDRVRTVLLPRGGQMEFFYDALGRPTRTTDEHANTREFTYDAVGDLSAFTLGEFDGGTFRQYTWRYTYDLRGRLRVSAGPASRLELDYDERDLIVEQREPAGVVARFMSGPFGEVLSRVIDPGGLAIESHWDYDLAGRLSRYTDPTGAVTSWERDGTGRVRALTLPDGSTWQRSFSVAARRLEEIAPSGARVSLELGVFSGQVERLTSFSSASAVPIDEHQFRYDELGRLIEATVGGEAIERSYDSLGRLIAETARGRSVLTGYDDLAGTTDLVFPDGRRERTQSDVGGRPAQVTLLAAGALGGLTGRLIAELDYAGVDRVAQITHGNGVVSSFAYDDARRLVRLDHMHAGALLDSSRVRYESGGQRAIVQLVGAPARTTLHDFDRRRRLSSARWGFPLAPLADAHTALDHRATITSAATAASAASESETFEHNKSDDRTKRVRNGTLVDTYVPAPDHRLLSVSGQARTYDADGHRVADEDHFYDIDALGRVVRVGDVLTGSVEAEFTYDALSRVVAGSRGGEPFTRWFSGDVAVHEVRGNGAVRQWSPHPLYPHPLCLITSAGPLFEHSDGAASTLCVTDATGQLIERHRFSPFGEPTIYAPDGMTRVPAGDAAVQPIWHGMPYLASVHLYSTPRRLYDPDDGVFLSRDPLLFLDSPSPYVYAAQSPVDFADPTGYGKAPIEAAGHSIAAPPPVGEARSGAYVPDMGFWSTYTSAIHDAFNPDTPALGRFGLAFSSVFLAPMAVIDRAITSTLDAIVGAGIEAGEHLGRGYLWTQQGEYAEAVAEALAYDAKLAEGFVSAGMVLESLVKGGVAAILPRRRAVMPDATKLALSADSPTTVQEVRAGVSASSGAPATGAAAEAPRLVLPDAPTVALQDVPGVWMSDFEGGANMARGPGLYQVQVGGRMGEGVYVRGPNGKYVQFDAKDEIAGALVEAKYWRPGGQMAKALAEERFWAGGSVVRQADRQLAAAGGYPIQWRIADYGAAEKVRQIFRVCGIDIEVIWEPALFK